MPKGTNDILIVGGGVIGCSILYFLARSGLQATLVEAGEIGAGASDAAAGSLLIRTADEVLHQLAVASFDMFPSLIDELRDLGTTDPLYSRTPRLDVAVEPDGEAALKTWVSHPTLRQHSPQWLTASEVLGVEPGLGPGVLGGLYVSDAATISGGRLAHAFSEAALTLGCEVRAGLGPVQLLERGGRVAGVRTDREVIEADLVILAAGAWTPSIAGAAGIEIAVRPVKGQTLRLRPAAEGQVRCNIYGPDSVLVPRPDGSLIAGFTLEDEGFDSRPTVSGARHILDRAVSLVPALADAAVERPQAGLRPESATGLPILGRVAGTEGLAVATGHYRVGIALSPITGRLMADHIIDGAPIPPGLQAA